MSPSHLGSSHVVHLSFGDFLACRRTVLVESSLFAVHPTDAGISFEVFRHSSSPVELQAIPLVVLPCSSVPLQSQPLQLVIENQADPIVGTPKCALNEEERSATNSRRANAYDLSNSSPGSVPSTDSVELVQRFSTTPPMGFGSFRRNRLK